MGADLPLRLNGLTKTFGATEALRDVSLTVEPGEVLGYLGPNGAGKTTTLRMVLGLLRPTAGSAEVFGLDTWHDAVAVQGLVGYVPGDPALYDRLTGWQHVVYVSNLRRGVDARAVRARGAELADRLDLDLHRQTRTLSRGNRQKVAIVLGFMTAPRLLVLDEPTGGLDPLVQQEFQAMVRERTAAGGSVLLSSHVLGEVQRVADRIGVLRAGRLVAMERLADLAAKSLHRVRASFRDHVDVGEFDAPGVRDLVVRGSTLTCSLPQAGLDALLKRVAAHDVVDFECAETELEEMFLAYYAGQSADAVPARKG